MVVLSLRVIRVQGRPTDLFCGHKLADHELFQERAVELLADRFCLMFCKDPVRVQMPVTAFSGTLRVGTGPVHKLAL